LAHKTNQQAGEYLKQLLGCVERRKRKRVEMNVPIKVKGSDVQGNIFEERTESLDISANGVAFFLKQRVRVTSSLELSVSRPNSSEVFQQKAQVVRVEDCSGEHGYKIAVKFV
jgi:c-di-GMP-binding flagellar brake protein YcgR